MWDEQGQLGEPAEAAWFETGLLGSGWNGARWIGSSVAPLSKYRSRFVVDYDVEIAKGSDRAVFVFGARDEANFVMAELDLNGEGDPCFRLSHSTDGRITADAAENIASIIPASAKRDKHHVRLEVTTAQYALKYFLDVWIDGKKLENTSLTAEEGGRFYGLSLSEGRPGLSLPPLRDWLQAARGTDGYLLESYFERECLADNTLSCSANVCRARKGKTERLVSG